MRIPFRYQATEFDCVPTTFINAIQYLFSRNEIPPEVIQKIMLYSLDTVNKNGEHGRRGTTRWAIRLILQWLESFTDNKFSFKKCDYLTKKQVHLKKGNEIMACLNNGGVALVRVCTGKTPDAPFHYMLALGVDERDADWLLFFDPYYRERPFTGENKKYLDWVIDKGDKGDKRHKGENLRIKRERLDSYEYAKYSMGPIEERECCLLERRKS